MRVTQIADLAGTTPRAVRHYHRLGLLEVPPTVRGRREYGVEHLARLLRIRWLADGGLSLRQVAEILSAQSTTRQPHPPPSPSAAPKPAQSVPPPGDPCRFAAPAPAAPGATNQADHRRNGPS